ncbi:hypothetical protein SAMN05192549_104350 [Duganella sacchari]|uniref:Uncharacterized protein n=1 Tax=Duganella sacchari TaxID=551987 RepID=A0A1M7P2S3_9BURK|nr:hypothetical protein [Duganella sacchari]SHN10759.1 hypothetical protein SAMN05192549_104350 [Duganella sacchari]
MNDSALKGMLPSNFERQIFSGHPCSGIWEPVNAPSLSFLEWITGESKLQPPFVVSARADGVYFITADKKGWSQLQGKGDILVSWYKLIDAHKDCPDGPVYLFRPGFTRHYPKSALTMKAVLASEITLRQDK